MIFNPLGDIDDTRLAGWQEETDMMNRELMMVATAEDEVMYAAYCSEQALEAEYELYCKEQERKIKREARQKAFMEAVEAQRTSDKYSIVKMPAYVVERSNEEVDTLEAEFNYFQQIEEEYEWFLNHNIDAFVETNLVKEGDMNVHSQQKDLQVA